VIGSWPTLTMSLPAEPATPSLVRERLHGWLAGLAWPSEAAADVVLAVSEAVSNAAEHAYPEGRSGTVDVVARAVTSADGARRIVTGVADHGSWRPSPDRPTYRGHGFAVMRACMCEVEVEPGKSGTMVVLVSVPMVAPT